MDKVFSGPPESILGWSPSGHSYAPSTDEEAWNLIYASRGVNRGQQAFEHPWGSSEGEELFWRQHFCRGRSFAAWPSPPLRNQRLQHHHRNQHKPVGFGGATAAKRECAGTGVFLPRRYCTNPHESGKRQACSPANLPAARMIQSSNKTFIPITGPPQIQPPINTSFVSHYDMLMSRRKAMILAAQQQRPQSNIHGRLMEAAVNNPDVLLPQEWTY